MVSSVAIPEGTIIPSPSLWGRRWSEPVSAKMEYLLISPRTAVSLNLVNCERPNLLTDSASMDRAYAIPQFAQSRISAGVIPRISLSRGGLTACANQRGYAPVLANSKKLDLFLAAYLRSQGGLPNNYVETSAFIKYFRELQRPVEETYLRGHLRCLTNQFSGKRANAGMKVKSHFLHGHRWSVHWGSLRVPPGISCRAESKADKSRGRRRS